MQMKFVRNLFESRPVLSPERMPDQGLILSSNDSVDAHIQCARAMDHSFLIVYTTNGSEFTLDLSRMPGKTLNAWWYNPRDGQLYSASHSTTSRPFKEFREKKITAFDPPGQPGDDQDWVLVIDDASKKYRPPGSDL